jgi:hypothetical protein
MNRGIEMTRGSIAGNAASGPPKKQRFEEGAVYQDARGNKARYQNGQWVPVK